MDRHNDTWGCTRPRGPTTADGRVGYGTCCWPHYAKQGSSLGNCWESLCDRPADTCYSRRHMYVSGGGLPRVCVSVCARTQTRVRDQPSRAMCHLGQSHRTCDLSSWAAPQKGHVEALRSPRPHTRAEVHMAPVRSQRSREASFSLQGHLQRRAAHRQSTPSPRLPSVAGHRDSNCRATWQRSASRTQC